MDVPEEKQQPQEEEVEGHRRSYEDMAGDDVEGHKLTPSREDMAGDDVEGHITPPSRVQPEH